MDYVIVGVAAFFVSIGVRLLVEVDNLAVDASPFGGADDIPAETWGDPETFDGESAAKLLGDIISRQDEEANRYTHER